MRRSVACLARVLVIAAFVAGTARATGAQVAAPAAPARGEVAGRILKHVVVIGASASYGIKLRASLADAVSGLIAVPHDATLDGAMGGFSVASLETRAKMVRLAAAQDPSALIALDYLFWYAHAFVADSQRLPRVRAALDLLDEFQCPVVIGLVPDMRPALGSQFFPGVMPLPETLQAINREVTEWAARRPHVIVVPLLETMDDMRAGRPVSVGPWTWPAGDQFRFVQLDKTHPTEEGLLVLARLAVEGLRARFPALQADDFVTDLEAARAGMLASAAARPFPRVRTPMAAAPAAEAREDAGAAPDAASPDVAVPAGAAPAGAAPDPH